MTFGEALTAMVTALSAADLERDDVTYEVLVGDEKLEKNGGPPRIVIVPLSASPASARMQPANSTTRSIAGENHLFVAELWAKGAKDDATIGKDYVAISTMKATFMAAMRATFGPTFQLEDGQWTATEGESIEEDGREYLQRFTLSALSMDFPVNNVADVDETVLNTGLTSPGEDLHITS